jgi:signal peptidase II
MKWSKGKSLLLLGVALVVIDQVIKVLVKTNMTLGESIPVLGSWFQLLFVENKGMAFGMSFGGIVGKYLLTTFRVVLFGVLCWWIAKLLRRGTGKDGESPVPTGVLVGLTLITAGAFGNIVDCLCYGLIFSESTFDTVATLGSYAPIMQGKVVDMFYFPLWTWPSWVPIWGGRIFFEPVFNFADSCVTVGAFYLILFHWKFFAKE